jgi:hypothetical protein
MRSAALSGIKDSVELELEEDPDLIAIPNFVPWS